MCFGGRITGSSTDWLHSDATLASQMLGFQPTMTIPSLSLFSNFNHSDNKVANHYDTPSFLILVINYLPKVMEVFLSKTK